MQGMLRIILGTIGLGLLLAGCGGGGGDAGGGPNFRLLLGDSPVDGADSVFVEIERVDLIRDDGGAETFVTIMDTPREFDLLELQNDVFAVLAEGDFPVGDYAGIRLVLTDDGGPASLPKGKGRAAAAERVHRIVIDGEPFPLAVPSGPQTGIKLLDPFTIRHDVLTELTIDFNVRASVIKRGSKDDYLLKPRLTLIETVLSASVEGALDSSDPTAPLTEATVSAQTGGREVLSTRMRADGTYRLSPLLPGTYALVVTAPGFAIAVRDNLPLRAGDELTGQDFTLDPAGAGGIAGTSVAGDDTAEIHLVWGGHFIALAGPDADTGEFAFENVPVGAYDVVLYQDGVETDRVQNVEVEAGTTTAGLALGLD